MLLIVHLMIQEDGIDVAAKFIIRIEAHPDFDVLFQLLNNLCMDEQQRFLIAYPDPAGMDGSTMGSWNQAGVDRRIDDRWRRSITRGALTLPSPEGCGLSTPWFPPPRRSAPGDSS